MMGKIKIFLMNHTKPPLLFLHGALGISKDVEPLMDIFREKGFEAHGLTFSGHGDTAAPSTDFRIDQFAKDLDAYMRQKSLHAPVMFGHSMGGYVALYHKAHFEDSPIRMIFTYGTKFNWSADSVRRELPFLVPETLVEKFPQLVENLKKKHADNWKHLLRSTAHMMQHLEKLDGLTKEDLQDLKIPVTLMLGDQDRIVTTEETFLASSWIHRSEVKIVAHSKHELERTDLREISSIMMNKLEM